MSIFNRADTNQGAAPSMGSTQNTGAQAGVLGRAPHADSAAIRRQQNIAEGRGPGISPRTAGPLAPTAPGGGQPAQPAFSQDQRNQAMSLAMNKDLTINQRNAGMSALGFGEHQQAPPPPLPGASGMVDELPPITPRNPVRNTALEQLQQGSWYNPQTEF